MLMGRAVWVERVFGLDKLSRVHRLNGYLSFTFIILHPLLITLGYSALSDTGFLTQFIFFIKEFDDLLNAFISMLLFISIVGLSVHIVRKRVKYETWYYVHLATYLAVLLAWGHQLELGSEFHVHPNFRLYWILLYAFVFGNLLIFRFIKPILNFFVQNFVVENVVNETDTCISIYIKGNALTKLKVQPGQFVIVRFLAWPYILQAHPFSFSAVPTNNTLRLTIKSVGDFTGQLKSLKPGTKVLLDGPFGIFTKKAATHNKFLFIAGGIGITPINAMLHSLASQEKDAVLLYANKFANDIPLKKELDALSLQEGIKIHYFCEETAQGVHCGRITKEKIKELVSDYMERDIFLCGPPPMMQSLLKDLQELGVAKSQIHFELFSL